MNTPKLLPRFCELVLEHQPNLSMTLLEIGARPISEEQEPFMGLLRDIPNSRYYGFEVEEQLCQELNSKTPDNVTFYPQAIAKSQGERTLYEAQHPVCSSLYEPNETLIDFFNGLDLVKLKEKHTLQTCDLDTFVEKENLEPIDFIKIDVQGAELEIFQGAENALKNVSMIVSEVEFAPIYKDQPLFSDVDIFLRERGFSFFKFLGLAGRSVKPILLNNNANAPSAHLWSDAVFVSNYLKLEELEDERLLKLALLAFTYNAPDLSAHCLKQYDSRHSTKLFEQLLHLFSN